MKSFIIASLFLFVSNVNAQACTASFYGVGDGFNGKRTASGKIFNTNRLMVAHRTLPFGTKVKVTNLNNNKSVFVIIEDRGPAKRTGRCIDLSYAAKNAIGMGGTAPVSLQVVK